MFIQGITVSAVFAISPSYVQENQGQHRQTEIDHYTLYQWKLLHTPQQAE